MSIRAGCAGAMIVMWLGSVSTAVAQTAEAQGPTQLLTGEQKTLRPGYAIGNIAIGDPKVCDFKILPGRLEVMLVAKGQGQTLLTLWDQRGVKRAEIQVEVTSREMAKLKADLTELLRPYPGVQVSGLGARLVLVGTVDTQAELQAIRALAQAAGGVQSLVTSREAAPSPGGVRAAPPAATPRAPAAAPRPVPAGTATLVPLGAGSQGGSSATAGAAPVAVGAGQPSSAAPAPIAPPPMTAAAANPPPPNVTSRAAAPPPVTASPVGGRGSAGIGAAASRVDYDLELIETSSSAPPPEVMGPQGRSLFKTRLSTTPGTSVRQFVTAEGATAPTAGSPVTGISIGVRPTVDAGGRIRTALVVDTNLPIGRPGAGATTQWARAQLEFTVGAGETRYLSERELGALLKPYSMGAEPQTTAAAGGKTPAAPRLTGQDAQIARTLGALFAKRESVARKTDQAPAAQPVLLIVITPYLATMP
jgi:hypothetical protein